MKSWKWETMRSLLCRYFHFIYIFIYNNNNANNSSGDNKEWDLKFKVQGHRFIFHLFSFAFTLKAAKTSLLCAFEFIFLWIVKRMKRISNNKTQKFQWECLAYLSIFPLSLFIFRVSQSIEDSYFVNESATLKHEHFFLIYTIKCW